jgi:hypothetical protein
MVAQTISGAANSTVDVVKYLPCLYHPAEVLKFGTFAFTLGVAVGILLGHFCGV